MFLDIQSTLHALAKEGTSLLSKRMIQHGQRSLRPLIRASPRLFGSEFMSILWRFTTHVEQVAVLGNIIATLLDAVILLVVHDVESLSVHIRKDLFALVEVTIKRTIVFRERISKILSFSIKLDIIRYMPEMRT
jgi:hypothetical protein